MGDIKLDDQNDKMVVARIIAKETVGRLSPSQMNDLGEYLKTIPESKYCGVKHEYNNILAAINNVNGAIMNIDSYLRTTFPEIYKKAEDAVLPSLEDIMGPYRRGEVKPTLIKDARELRRFD